MMSRPGLLLADATWLLTRDERTGRRGCHRELAGVVVAAGLVAEQFLLQTMSLDGDRIVVFDPVVQPFDTGMQVTAVADPGRAFPSWRGSLDLAPDAALIEHARENALVRAVYERVRVSRDVRRLGDWLEILAPDAEYRVGERLVATAGVAAGIPKRRTWWPGGRGGHRLLDTDKAAALAGRLDNRIVGRAQELTLPDLVLCGLVRACHLDHKVFTDRGPAAYADLDAVTHDRLPACYRVLIDHAGWLAAEHLY